MSEIMLNTTSDELISKASEISREINAFEYDWKKIEDIILNSKGYWAGDAGDVQRKQLKDLSSDMSEIIRHLKEHPKNILKMAGLYQEAEQEVKKIAIELPADAII